MVSWIFREQTTNSDHQIGLVSMLAEWRAMIPNDVENQLSRNPSIRKIRTAKVSRDCQATTASLSYGPNLAFSISTQRTGKASIR